MPLLKTIPALITFLILSGCGVKRINTNYVQAEKEWKESQLQPAPDGTSWKYFEKPKTFFLVPEAWFVLEESQGSTEAVFISKTKISPPSEFEVGFSANIIKSYANSPLNKEEAEAMIFSIYKIVSQTADVDEFGFTGDGEYFRGVNAVIKINNQSIKVYSSILINLKSGTLYNCTAEAPIDQMIANEEKLTAIMSNLVLDPRY